TSPPTWLMNTTTLLAGVTIPLMLLTLGSSLAQLKIIDAPKILSISVAKIAIGMTIGIYTAYLFGLQGVERNVLILQMSMPVAVFSYLLASKYGRNPDEVASLIFITTLITLISVPLMLIYLF
ncbi:MAG: AEC family transporter, partial [Proteobacteria bacterium]|nr:AEC family transporter [Pseudomonadota bacterium]